MFVEINVDLKLKVSKIYNMKKIKKMISILNKFRTKVTLILIFSMIFSAGLCNIFIYKYTYDAQFDLLREKLMIIASTAALSIDSDLFSKVPLRKNGINSKEFKIINSQLQKIKKVDSSLKYVYTMVETSEYGVLKFVVDPDASELEDEGATSFPGDEYDATRFPEMLKAFDGASADTELGIDEWGVLLSGYAPILDNYGKAVGIIGVDVAADDVYEIQKALNIRIIYMLIFGVIFSLIAGTLLSNKIADRLDKLIEGTRRIKDEDFKYQVNIGGKDEISELAHSFNIMAKSLYLSRKKTHKYFYRAMQSLVRVLEAKDVYTLGHSDRVADYAERIAVKMKLSGEKIEMIKDAAYLHDIGKIGIQKTILNKKGALTTPEWDEIKMHTILGEDILRPVVFDKKMLNIVKYHHERYDGTGYPDKLKGKEIDLFAQIVSVADSYDAMTSNRAYKKAIDENEAIGEIYKGRGRQFNPKVVDAFIDLMQT